jgi:hypothetical protein
MEFSLLSGVVRNRKVTPAVYEDPQLNRIQPDSQNTTIENISIFVRIWRYLVGNFSLFRNFTLRVHKFKFKWDLFFHLFVCISSLIPFAFSGNRLVAIFPLSVWGFYNIFFFIGTSRMSSLLPGAGRIKHAFTASIEEFFSAKLLPMISVSFLLVICLLTATGKTLGGPPICYSSCHVCLAKWSQSELIPEGMELESTPTSRHGCGYLNGKELLSFYTISQTSSLMFVTVLLSMAVCMAWKVAEEEFSDRQLVSGLSCIFWKHLFH